MSKEHLVPAAILAGFAMVAIAVYFGLKGAPARPPVQVASPAPTSAALEPPPRPAALPLGPPEPPSALREAVEADAKKAVAAERSATFVTRCWAPAIAAKPQPAASRYSLQMTFDATGKEIARGLSEIRGVDSRPDVAQCLRGLPIGLTVPARGATVQVTLELSFP